MDLFQLEAGRKDLFRFRYIFVNVIWKIGVQSESAHSIPLECYELISAKTKKEQEHIYRILLEIDKYKDW